MNSAGHLRRLGFAAALAAFAGRAPAAPPSSRFAADLAALTSAPHRLTGTPEGGAAAAHLERRLREIGAEWVVVQPFATVRAETRRCELRRAEGAPLALLPMRPNGLMLPTTPPGGLRGRLVRVGPGEASDFAEREVRGAIVVMDFNGSEGWLRAFRLGAQAVVFTPSVRLHGTTAYHLDVQLNLPRFYYDGPAADLPDGVEVTIESEIVWQPAVGRNIVAFFRGTNPVFAQNREEAIVLSADYDSYGAVPERSPDARGAANAAALLKLAESLRARPPRRHTLIVFFDAQWNAQEGSSTFYMALEDKHDLASVAKRRMSLDAERQFLDALRGALAEPHPLTTASRVRRALLKRVEDAAKSGAFEIGDRMAELRRERLALRAQLGTPPRSNPPPEIIAQIEEIGRELDEQLQPEKDRWNDLRRALSRDRYTGLAPEVEAKLQLAYAKVRESVERRSAELELEGARLAADEQLQASLKSYWLTLHLALLLGDATDRWGLIIGGDSYFRHPDDNPGLYGRLQNVFLRAYRDLEAAGRAPEAFETATADQTLTNTRILFAGRGGLRHGGEPAGAFGFFNAALGTVQEAAGRDGTPFDTPDRLDAGRIERQTDAIARLLFGCASLDVEASRPDAAPEPGETAGVADQAGLSLRRGIVGGKEYAWSRFERETTAGPTVMGMLPGSSVPDTPVPGAMVFFMNRNPASLTFNAAKPLNSSLFRILRTDENGNYRLGPSPGGAGWTDARGFAAVFDDRGELVLASNQQTLQQVKQRLNAFRARAGGIVLPPPLRATLPAGSTVRLLSAFENGDLDPRKRLHLVNDGAIAWFSEQREKAVKIFNLDAVSMLGIGPERLEEAGAEDAAFNWLGDGFPMIPRWTPVPATRRSAVDLWRLNESRLRVLQGKNIIDSSLAELHGRVEDLLLEAQRRPATLRAEALDAEALWAARPVYRKTRAIIDDLVFAVLILLGLAVPFAFAMERVVVGAVTVYRQIGWFVVFFAATFGILFVSHPAFAIANTPIIIFLGFAILTLSGMVISIIMRKFEVELKAMQGMTATVHAADVSRVNTVLAAMQMGISTMRRRPLRTALTAVTIILLTFTILSFASFGTQSGLLRLFVAPAPGYAGAWMHDANWQPIAPELLDTVEGRWGADADVCGRWWISPRAQAAAGGLLTREDGTRPIEIPAVLGFDAREIRRRPDLAALVESDLEGAIQITPAVARALGVAPGDRVRFRGKSFRVARLTDATAFSSVQDMDGASVLPVDFTEVRSSQPASTQVSEEASLHASVNWTSLPVDSVAILSAAEARAMGAALHGIAVYAADVPAAREIGAALARMLPMPVAVTQENGVYRQVLGTLVAASGAADLFFPILLGGLVIFGTMLGSVADREREIYTFSALGLAPRHVATLFLSEALVYSLIGGMGGYLLAQGMVRILTALAEHGWVRVPEMNMSSTNTIVTILIVMATVLVSAIYPAVKASKSANPGLMRTWRPPAPDGDRWDMIFPFTVSEYDLTGVVSFLKEHFDNHSDTGLGRFMARESALVRPQGTLGLRSTLMLAPFDLGVSQRFHLQAVPSEIPGIDEVHIRLERISGQPKDWQRLNRVFLKDLRQQFLIWRSIPQEAMETYRERTLTHFGAAAAETKPTAN